MSSPTEGSKKRIENRTFIPTSSILTVSYSLNGNIAFQQDRNKRKKYIIFHMENIPPPLHPNWLVCSSCMAPIVTASELICEEVPALRTAVYAYRLDMLEREVSVYSATNTSDHRFDVVRADLSESIQVPSIHPSPQVERESLRLFLRHFQVISLNEPDVTLDNPHQLAEELDRLLEETNTSPAESDGVSRSGEDVDSVSSDGPGESPPKRRRCRFESICDRIETKFEEPTDEYTWFPPYSWTIASCRQCHEHLGWVFWHRPDQEWVKVFVSLIVTRLREKFISEVRANTS